MGYRSDVCLAVTKECYKENATQALKDALKDCYKVYENDRGYYFSWDNVKWYEDYPDVKVIEEFMEEHNDSIGFVRIGEDMDDIELKGDQTGFFEIYPMRTIDLPKLDKLDRDQFFAGNAEKFIESITEVPQLEHKPEEVPAKKPTTDIFDVARWTRNDIIEKAKELLNENNAQKFILGDTISDEDVDGIIEKLKDRFDASVGINWDTISHAIDDYFELNVYPF